MSHAPFAPSALSRLMVCSASFDLCKIAPPQEDTEHTLEGTAAHEVISTFYENGELMQVGHKTSNGELVTQDMINGAEIYFDYVSGLGLTDIKVESRVTMECLHIKCWGTPDLYSRAGDIHVVDYKFGHSYVEVYKNWQLIAYAAGVCNDKFNPDRVVHLHIVQPRCYMAAPCRVWTTTVGELRAYWNLIRAQLELIDSGKDLTCTVSKECIHCPARIGCVAYKSACNELIEFAEIPSYAPGNIVDQDHELLILEDAVSIINGRIEILKTIIEAELRGGKSAPNYHMKSEMSRARWLPSADVKSLGEMMGVNLIKEPEFMTPAQVKKVLPKSAAVIVDSMSERTPVIKLERVNHSEISRIFKGN